MQRANRTAEEAFILAHDIHYSRCDVLSALRLYSAVVTDHPGSSQAQAARLQIQRITRQLMTSLEVLIMDLSDALSDVRDDAHRVSEQ